MSFDVITHTAVKALEKEVQSLKLAQTASNKPLRVTEYTSGAGTHSFLPESTYQYISLIGAGGAGGRGYFATNASRSYRGSGGAAGDELFRRISLQGNVYYEVGAGTAGRGGNTRLGLLWVDGGSGGPGADLNNDAPPTVVSIRRGLGITPGSPGTGASGGSSLMGVGGSTGTTAGNATGYGAGGGGTVGQYSGTLNPTFGTGGYIRIEEY